MKNKKFLVLGSIALSACFIIPLAACTESGESNITSTPLAVPANVQITTTDNTDVEAFSVTFDAVENASPYRIYVYQEGDTQAKVTSTTTTTGELPNDLEPGDYMLSVLAVGNGINYTNSNGSEPQEFTLEKWEIAQLGTVSDVEMDWTVDIENQQYPVLSFSGVDNPEDVQYYSVEFFSTDTEGNRAEGDAVAFFNVPAGSSSEVVYELTADQYGDFTPGCYDIDIYARPNNTNRYENGDVVTASTVWTYGKYLTPEISVQYGYYENFGPESASTDGVTIFVDNYADYFAGDVFTVEVYSDAACTDLVTTAEFTYTSREMFGIAIVNNYVSIDVEETLSLDTAYYYRVMIKGDGGVVFEDSDWSEVVEFTATEDNYQGSSGGGNPGGPGGGGNSGGPGGGGNPGGCGATITLTQIEAFAQGADTVTVTVDAMGTACTLTGTLEAVPTDGSAYTYSLSGTGGMGESITGTLEIVVDNTVSCTVGAFGPFSETTFNGSWTLEGGQITVTMSE